MNNDGQVYADFDGDAPDADKARFLLAEEELDRAHQQLRKVALERLLAEEREDG